MQETTVENWHAHLSVENAELDAQHITLIEIGRSIVSSIEQGADSAALGDLMEDFVALSKMHDKLEEAILLRNHCPSLAAHQQVHLESRKVFAAYLQQTRTQTVDKDAIASAISHWMEHHVSENDMMVKDYLKA